VAIEIGSWKPRLETASPRGSRGRTRPKVRTPSEWTRALHNAGLRRTAPRIAVLERLEVANGPLAHGDLVEMLAHLGYDRATLYRNLTDLAGAGLVTRADLGHLWRFELVRGESRHHSSEHPHFLCNDCGKVSCLLGVTVRILSRGQAPRAVGERAVEIQLKGLCDLCA
jgi:Fur family transcriptional regulator, ferric uptake regulator